ncbi:hypothetical protein KR054_006532 [Drosophila jambulina]|nr:hypothetical protein KR054_006532 [Drosophila jambulina]
MSFEFPVTKKTMDCLCQRSPYTQIGVGAVGGFLTGFVFLKTSKLMALATGGMIIAVELAVQADLIQLDTFEVCPHQAPAQLRITGQTHQPEAGALTGIEILIEKSKKTSASSQRLAVAFLGGFLLGFGCA